MTSDHAERPTGASCMIRVGRCQGFHPGDAIRV